LTVKLNNFDNEFLEIQDGIINVITEVLKNGEYILGEKVNSFEKIFAKYIGTKYCIGVASGTDALTLALLTLQISKGDEVITPNFTAFPTIRAILNAGAKPKLVDIDYSNGLIDLDQIESSITNRTKAIIPVHLYGNVCEMDKLCKITKEYNLVMIEDCAQALGAKYNGIKTGNFGICSAFSFYPTKNIGAYGDAGAIITNDKKIYEDLKSLRNYGLISNYLHQSNGLNSRLDEIQAGILEYKLNFVDEWNNRRNSIANYYKENIVGHKFFSIKNNVDHAYHIFAIKCINRKMLIHHLKTNGIESKIHYPKPINHNTFLNELNSKNYPISSKLANEVLSLPINPWINDSQVEFVVDVINKFQNE
tara:strand:- start:160 stop:1251 length:1092 start_codon:yes stop_codon:yes gene_type:complete